MSESAHLLTLFLNTLAVGALGSTLAVVGALGILCSVSSIGGRLGKVILILSTAFLLVPTYAIAGAWSGTGSVGLWLSMAPADAAGSTLRSIVAVSSIHGVAKMPFVLLCLIIAMRRLSKDVVAMSLLERSWLKTLRGLILPYLMPWTLLSWLACMMLIHSDMVISNLYQLHTMTERVYLNESLGTSDSTTPWLCMLYALLLSVLTTLVAIQCVRRDKRPQSHNRSGWMSELAEPYVRRSSIVLSLLLLSLYVILPLSNVVYKSGYELRATTTVESGPEPLPMFSITRAVSSTFWSFVDFSNEYRWTAELALWTVILALCISAMLIYCGWRSRIVSSFIAIGLLLMLATPGPILNKLAILTFNRQGELFTTLYSDTLVPCICCLQFRVLPFVMLVLWPSVNAIHERYRELWSIEFGRQFPYLWKGLLPSVREPLLMSVVAGLAVAVGDLSSYLLVLPPGVTTVAMRVFDLLHYAVRYREAGLILGLILMGCLLSSWGMRRFVI